MRSNVSAQKNTEVEAPRASRNGRILVVDANESVLEAVAELLSGIEHRVTTSTSMEEARRLVSEKEFDLVVADWQLLYQGESSHAKAEQFPADHGLGARVLWTSSVSAMEKMPARFLTPEASVLQKPFQPGELYAAVEAKLFGVAAPILQE